MKITNFANLTIRPDLLSAIEAAFPTGLPLDRSGVNFISRTIIDADSIDFLWLFELLSFHEGLMLLLGMLPASPFGQTETRLTLNSSLSTLSMVASNYAAAQQALLHSAEAKHMTGSALSAAAHKHVAMALVATKGRTEGHYRVAIHLAKAAAAIIALESHHKSLVTQQAIIENFFFQAFLALLKQFEEEEKTAFIKTVDDPPQVKDL